MNGCDRSPASDLTSTGEPVRVATISPDPVETTDTSASRNQRLTNRSIRSFVVRNGRTTDAQSQAIENLLPRYGIPFQDAPIDLNTVFNRDVPVWLEIGFGNADALLDMATRYPEINLLGVEVHTPGIGRALIGIESLGLSNVRVIHHDVVEVLHCMLQPDSLARVLLFFPDPWHKKRHHKRRIVQQEFLDLVAQKLQSKGMLHCATDWAEYAEWMMDLLSTSTSFSNTIAARQFAEQPPWRMTTRFERRGQKLGHAVFDLLFTKST